MAEQIKRLITLGVPSRVIADTLGVSPGRVSQMHKRPRPDEPAPEVPDHSVRASAPKGVPMLPEGVALVSSGHASTRHLAHYGQRVTAWVDLDGGRGVTDNGQRFDVARFPAGLRGLLVSLPRDVVRVYVVGGREVFTDKQATPERVRAAFLAAAGDGWEVSTSGLYLADPDLPVGRWTHEDGRSVELHRAATWLGEGDYSIDQAAQVMATLSELLRARFGTGQWLSTPATTGRDLWRRTIPEGRSFPVLSDELRGLIHSTSGQGRAELLPPLVDTLPGFHYLDGRFMYAGLVWGLPVVTDEQPPVRWTRAAVEALPEDQRARVFAGRGRWLVDVTVPDGWAHVGVLPVMVGNGWQYPSEPGRRFRTWVDGAELLLAAGRGWHVQVVEGVTFAEGKPLNLWREKLVDAWQTAGDLPEPLAGLVRGALRAMVLFSVGAFAARTHTVTRYGSEADAREADDAGRIVGAPRTVGDRLTWQENLPATAWSENMAHPEWSATVWARARVRLLDHPLPGGGRGGALHLPRASVLAFRTDALYLSEDPRWPDDGAVGRFRNKGSLTGPLPAPTTLAELFKLRDQAEGTT